MLKKIYFNNKENECASFLVYADSTDNKLYDSVGTGKKQITQEELNRAFLIDKLLICTDAENGVFEKPVRVSANKAYTMNSTTVETTTTVSMVEWAALATPAA